MEGTSHRRRRVLVVRRDYENSRLEQAQLAAAYERVLPEVRVVLAESRCRAKTGAHSVNPREEGQHRAGANSQYSARYRRDTVG